MALVHTVNFKKVRNNVDWYQVFEISANPTTPITLAGASLKMDIRPALGGPPVLVLTIGNGLIVIDEAGGRFAINVDHTLLEVIPVGSYKHDLIIIRGGFSQPIWEGSLKIKNGITNI